MSEPLKPWQSPEVGDVWVLTQCTPYAREPITKAWTFYEGVYEYGPLVMSPNNSSILSGYRIWPPHRAQRGGHARRRGRTTKPDTKHHFVRG